MITLYEQFKISKNNYNCLYKTLNNNNNTIIQNKDLELQITNICDDPA